MSKKRKKEKVEKVDGINPKDLQRIRSALRDIWRYSEPWKRARARAIGKDGFSRCEGCKKKVPHVFLDHLVPMGVIDDGVIRRLFCPSTMLQNLCKKCHGPKTAAERKALKQKSPYLVGAIDDVGDFI